MAVRIGRGIDIRYKGAPRQAIGDGPAIASVAVLGTDYPGMRLDVLVEPGSAVAAGEPLLRDRKHHDRLIVAPSAGQVSAVTRGARRSVETVEIELAGEAATVFERLPELDREALVSLLNASGLWAAIRTRPFGRPAELCLAPEALFVTAIDTRPLAADPAIVIGAHDEWFRRGAETLTVLTPGPTYLCQAAGAALPPVAGATAVEFTGAHPAGLPGTHIHHLHPVGREGRVVWQVGYQDVIALGHLLTTGRVWAERIVAVGGPAVASPAVLRTRPGANLRQLTKGRLAAEGMHLFSGSLLDGRVQDFLARDHLQVSAAPHRVPDGVPSLPMHILHKWMRAGIQPVIPNSAHERAAPIGILPIPLLRALSVGDAVMAKRLGALELVEEDLALLTHVDGGDADYGMMLRLVLDDLQELA